MPSLVTKQPRARTMGKVDVDERKRKSSEHAQKVYSTCMLVPKGKVTTYMAIAKVIGSCPRAVGQALRANPHAPKVPCHRVISTSLELGGFKGTSDARHESLKEKKEMLRREGIEFVGDKIADRSYVLDERDLMSRKRGNPKGKMHS